MSEMKKFNKGFVKRTSEILNEYEPITEYNVTLLLNCLIGLIVFPIEELKDEHDKITNQFKSDCVNKLKELSGDTFKVTPNSVDDDKIFRNIRNSVAHINVELKSKENIIDKVIFINKQKGRKGDTTLEYALSVSDLKKFALYIATEYLNRIVQDKEKN